MNYEEYKKMPIILKLSNTGEDTVFKLFSGEPTKVTINTDNTYASYDSILRHISENGFDCEYVRMICKNKPEQHNEDVYIVNKGVRKLLDFNRCSPFGKPDWIGNINIPFSIDKDSYLEYSILSGAEVTLYFFPKELFKTDINTTLK